MFVQNKIDIKENKILEINKDLLKILLKDRTTGCNIIGATNDYSFRGESYKYSHPILMKSITNLKGNVIKPRIEKSKKIQKNRIIDKAEVFTPSRICKEQIDLFKKQFALLKRRDWKQFILLPCLEMACGEAPYLVSRYDTITGKSIPLKKRVGLLDVKMRFINDKFSFEPEGYEGTLNAFKSIFGFEWQGDSLLIARENMFHTFIDYYQEKFKKKPPIEYLFEIARIISGNLFQMDGLNYTLPIKNKKVYVTIMDGKNNSPIKFIDLIGK